MMKSMAMAQLGTGLSAAVTAGAELADSAAEMGFWIGT